MHLEESSNIQGEKHLVVMNALGFAFVIKRRKFMGSSPPSMGHSSLQGRIGVRARWA